MSKVRRFLSNVEYETIYSLVPRVCIDLVIKKSNKLILTLRKIEPNRDKWHLPGGRLRKDESVVNAITRITKDELGKDIKIKPIRLIGYMEFIPDGKLNNGTSLHSVSFVFFCKIITGDAKIGSQSTKIDFFELKNIPSRQKMIKQHFDFLHKLEKI